MLRPASRTGAVDETELSSTQRTGSSSSRLCASMQHKQTSGRSSEGENGCATERLYSITVVGRRAACIPRGPHSIKVDACLCSPPAAVDRVAGSGDWLSLIFASTGGGFWWSAGMLSMGWETPAHLLLDRNRGPHGRFRHSLPTSTARRQSLAWARRQQLPPPLRPALLALPHRLGRRWMRVRPSGPSW
jgi:hypothetical protein